MVKSAPAPTAQGPTPQTPGQRSPTMERMALAREYKLYEVKKSPSTRKLVDVVGQWELVEERGRALYDKSSKDPPCLVSNGWTTICGTCAQSRTVRKRSFPRRSPDRSWKHSMCSYRVMRCIPVSSVYWEITLAVLRRLDLNVNNIFLTDIDSASPVVKLRDLGNVELK